MQRDFKSTSTGDENMGLCVNEGQPNPRGLFVDGFLNLGSRFTNDAGYAIVTSTPVIIVDVMSPWHVSGRGKKTCCPAV